MVKDFDKAVATLRRVYDEHCGSDPDFDRMLESRNRVLEHYGNLFSPENLAQLTADDFKSFLHFENNTHWTGLHRQGPRMCKDINHLREALALLLNQTKPLDKRLSQTTEMVLGMGKAVATAILLVVYPNDYGVWNNTSQGGLVELKLWPLFERGITLGQKYEKVNDLLKELAHALKIDLWTLDAIWWRYLKSNGESPPPDNGSSTPDSGFGLERHLHDFIRDNWSATVFAKDGWDLLSEDGESDAGYEYPTEVGRIDLLARHRNSKKWLVIELKRNQSSDAALGQTLRYMAWVRKHLAEERETVEGVIISKQADQGLMYALTETPQVKFLGYKVDFTLFPEALK